MHRKGNSIRAIVGILSIILLTSATIQFLQIYPSYPQSSTLQIEEVVIDNRLTTMHIPHDPIIIISNENFTSIGFPGNGTPEEPYIISGYNISATENCISIKNTDAFFEIRDCLIIGVASDDCIELVNVTNGLIANNTISGSANCGVCIDSTLNTTIADNTITENQHGMYIYLSDNNTIVNNSIYGNLNYGAQIYASMNNTVLNNTFSENDDCVYLLHSYDNIIENNTITSSTRGILFGSSRDNLVENNTIADNTRGIAMSSSWDNIIQNNTITGSELWGVSAYASQDNMFYSNTFVNNGIHLSDDSMTGWRQIITLDNLVNGKPIGYFWDLSNVSMDGAQYGQVILANCRNITVENGTYNNASIGSSLGFSSFCTLRNITSSDNYCGVFSISSSNNTIENCSIFRSSYYGLYLGSSTNNTITNCTVKDNWCGVYLIFSTYNKLEHSTSSQNFASGIFITASSNNSVTNSNLSENQYGIQIANSDNNTVTNNFVSLNSQTGISISGLGNLIYLNIITGNSRNGYDNGNGNHWNSTGVGNSWSDYDGGGVYEIPGSAESIDFHPSTAPDIAPPTIDEVHDMEYEFGTEGHAIIWQPNDEHPSHYVVYRNNSVIDSDTWYGGFIFVYVAGLDIGVYNFTIIAYDTSGYYVTDTVLVTVIPASTGTTTTATTSSSTSSTTPVSSTIESTTTTNTTTGGTFDISITIMIAGVFAGIVVIVIIIYRKKITS